MPRSVYVTKELFKWVRDWHCGLFLGPGHWCDSCQLQGLVRVLNGSIHSPGVGCKIDTKCLLLVEGEIGNCPLCMKI